MRGFGFGIREADFSMGAGKALLKNAGAVFFSFSASRAAASLAAEVLHASPPAPVLVLGLGAAMAEQDLALAERGLSCLQVDCSSDLAGSARQRLPGAAAACGGALLRASASALPFADKSFGLAVVSLLARLDGAACFIALDELFRVSSRLILLEWRLPERNLDYPFHLLLRLRERAAGAASYQAFADFMRQGALEGVMRRYALYREQAGLPACSVLKRRFPAPNSLLLLAESGG
jgi:hypothetical protein